MTYLIVALLLAFSGLFSGLILSLMSLEPSELKRKARLGDSQAAKIYPLRRKGNQLLCTLILANVAANASLAIFLDSKTSGVVAGLMSTFLITIFAEILPQSLLPRFALSLGSRLAWFVQFFIVVLSPVCRPISWVLDKLFGEELPTIYSRRELIAILEEHGQSTASDIRRDEEVIASGALSFGAKPVKDVMTPRSVTMNMHANDVLDHATIEKLTQRGYSRLPVLNETDEKVVGILYAYRLIGRHAEDKLVSEVCSTKVRKISEDATLDKALKMFIKLEQKLFVVVNRFSEYVGVLTIEDVLEEILGQEIVDEFDEHRDMRKVAERAARARAK